MKILFISIGDEVDYQCDCLFHGLCFLSNIDVYILSDPQAKIVHLEGKSFSVEERKLRMYYEGRKIFYLKCYSYLYRTISNVIFRFTCLTRILFYSMLKHRALSSWKTVWTVFNEVNRKA